MGMLYPLRQRLRVRAMAGDMPWRPNLSIQREMINTMQAACQSTRYDPAPAISPGWLRGVVEKDWNIG